MDHSHQHHQLHEAVNTPSPVSNHRLAFSSTLHCLAGCGLGEVAGMIIGTALEWDNHSKMVLGVVLGFIGGFALGILPLLRANFTFERALKQVLIAEGLSIVVMETAEVLVQVYTPGVMHADLSDEIFWLGMLLALAAGFVAAYPVNYFMIKKGQRHLH
jgi:hypothetical protein